MSYSRKTVRDALASLLNTALTGTGKPAQAVYGYQVGDFQGQSPVVIVTSAGSERDQLTMATRRTSHFHLNIHILVLNADPSSGWTEAMAEDALDTIEQLVDQTLAANLVTTTWRDVAYDGRSTVINVALGGSDYRYELIPVAIAVTHD